MGLPKGRTNNLNGRPPLSENILIKEFRDELIQGLKPELPKYLKDLNDLRKNDPIKALYIYLKYLQLVLPKMKEIDISGDLGISETIDFSQYTDEEIDTVIGILNKNRK